MKNRTYIALWLFTLTILVAHGSAVPSHAATDGSGSPKVSSGTAPCPISITQDLSFTIPYAVYDGGPSVGQMALKIDFQFHGEQNGQLLWQLGDVDMSPASASCAIPIAQNLSFTLTDAVYDAGPPAGQITLQALFEYAGEQNGVLLWHLADLTVSAPDPPPMMCGAYVAPGVWKQFDCYNLAAIGKTTNDDPFTPSWRLIGGHWQWGRKGPDQSQWYTTNTSFFAHGPGGMDTGEANSDDISGWDQTDAPDGAWSDSFKTATDPCPDGFRVPAKAHWDGVLSNNPQSVVGTWSTTWDTHTNNSAAWFFGSDLMLPAAGYRHGSDGSLNDRGGRGYYWSSTPYASSDAWRLAFVSSYTDTDYFNRQFGFSVRCVAE